jgi:hypothetical protein
MNTKLGTARWIAVAIAAAVALTTATSAGAGSAFTLSVTPTQLILIGSSKGTFTVRNPSKSSIPLTAAVGNYIIKPNGRVVVDPKLPPKRSAKRWLTISPKHFTVKGNGTFELKVRSHPGRKAGPGDHHALVLFTSKPSAKGKVLVRTRIGVGVLVRVKGKIKRRLAIASLSALRSKHKLRLVIANRGNINERLLKKKVGLTLIQGKRTVQKLWAPPRQVLPHSRTVYSLTYRSGLKGQLKVIVTVRPVNGAPAGAFAPPLKPVTRTFRIRF